MLLCFDINILINNRQKNTDLLYFSNVFDELVC